ncbi:PAS domain-containing hybrid sensor histidine kinase/response regulator [Piscinibacter terrae]|uniref:histidine kinase n=1 Tax=Piscinibacter terrae TaxID=2496871 RepID=A0A3N7HGU8_9BURK|nr:PAS domain S-box protein [Albitalea terrae]RQP21237.1 PAS domain S-box protein [Albitalea terrae]
MKRSASPPPASPPAEPLRHSEERFRLLVESVQDYAIFMIDPEGIIQTWNAGAQRLKGYNADEVIGQSFEIFYPGDAIERGWPRQELAEARKNGRIEDEGWRLRKDGTRFWASVVITALRGPEGDLRGFAKVTRDLTERREQQEALRRSEEQLRLMVESVKDYAIFMLDPTGNVVSWNAGARAIKGYTSAEILGKNFAIFFTAADADAGKPQRELADARLQGRVETEAWRVRKDGSVFWAHVVITPVVDHEGVLRGYSKVTRDMSDHRRLVELEHSSQRMNEFLAMLAHELRNPLAPIRNAVSILQVHPLMPAQLAGTSDIIDRQLVHLTRLVDDLLDIARISTGKIVLRHEALDFREVVHASMEATRPLAAARRHRVHLDMPEQPIRMTGDHTRLVQALQNLLSNAVRYTPAGGDISVRVQLEGQAVVTSVTDTGVGIAPEALERIFELFAQESGKRTPAEGGLGIGLSLARSLVEQHGGLLTAASAGLGQGSTFTMLLPLRVPGSMNGPTHAPTSLPKAARPLRALVIDDNRDSADTMVYVLQLLGHGAQAAYGAQQGLAVAAEIAPQLVLLDLNMPDGSGFEVMRQLRAAIAHPVYIAAMTGYGQNSDRASTLAAGFDMHLTKPVGTLDLNDALAGATRLLDEPVPEH